MNYFCEVKESVVALLLYLRGHAISSILDEEYFVTRRYHKILGKRHELVSAEQCMSKASSSSGIDLYLHWPPLEPPPVGFPVK